MNGEFPDHRRCLLQNGLDGKRCLRTRLHEEGSASRAEVLAVHNVPAVLVAKELGEKTSDRETS